MTMKWSFPYKFFVNCTFVMPFTYNNWSILIDPKHSVINRLYLTIQKKQDDLCFDSRKPVFWVGLFAWFDSLCPLNNLSVI